MLTVYHLGVYSIPVCVEFRCENPCKLTRSVIGTTPQYAHNTCTCTFKISSEQEEWTETEIADLKEGLRKYGKAWGKIYREIGSGSSRTATQCKQFFDNCSHDRLSELHQALAEHSSIKVSSGKGGGGGGMLLML